MYASDTIEYLKSVVQRLEKELKEMSDSEDGDELSAHSREAFMYARELQLVAPRITNAITHIDQVTRKKISEQ